LKKSARTEKSARLFHRMRMEQKIYRVSELNEIVKALVDGAPELRCEELNDDGPGRSWGLYFAGGTDVPDLLTGESAGNPVMLYAQAENAYHYIFVSTRSAADSGWDFTDTKYALTLRGDLLIEELASMKMKLGSPGSDLAERRFFLPAWRGTEAESGEIGTAQEISADRYAEIGQERFGPLPESPAFLLWLSAEEIRPLIGQPGLSSLLERSFRVFLDGGQYY